MCCNKPAQKSILGFTPYQWLVLLAAWIGWGFDVFDALLFNYVSRLCIPSLLGPGHNDPQSVARWTGIITSILLIGWGIGGIFFGKVTDRLGRTKTLLLTMLTYALATAACAFAHNIWMLLFFRFIASLGIGGEWAAGAALVAETVPDNKRVHAGALLYTASPAGLFLATFVTDVLTRRIDYLAANPDISWRIVFLTGLIPAAAAVLIRWHVHEPELWKKNQEEPRFTELFTASQIRNTLGGLAMASTALVTWWSFGAFLPLLASLLATDAAAGLAAPEQALLKARFITIATSWFNLGGLCGTLLTVPFAVRLGRRPMFACYYLCGATLLWGVLRLGLDPYYRLYIMFFVGIPVFGVFGAFPFYLPELFPTRLRGTGSGFCYNFGRLITAAGPFLVGWISSQASGTQEMLRVVSWIAVMPLAGGLLALSGAVTETKGRSLADSSCHTTSSAGAPTASE